MLFRAFYIFGLVFAGHGSVDWSKNGDNWGAICATGNRQSPVDLLTYTAEMNTDPFKLELDVYRQIEWDISVSSGLKFTPQSDPGITVSGGYLPGTYKLAQFHLHWGSNTTGGSEHTINNEHYWGELHMVFYSNKYENLGSAVSDPNGLAVLGFFVHVPEGGTQIQSRSDFIIQKALNNLNAKKVTIENKMVLPNYIIQWMGPMDDIHSMDEFYRYDGGLTTPGCNEVVVWTVFRTSIKINENTKNMLLQLVPSGLNSFRSTKPLNGRKITLYGFHENSRNYPQLKTNNFACRVQLSVLLFLLPALIFVI